MKDILKRIGVYSLASAAVVVGMNAGERVWEKITQKASKKSDEKIVKESEKTDK